MITDDELKQIMPKCAATKRAEYLPFINQAMEEFEITRYLRKAAFLAQVAHESLELSVMEERDSAATFLRYEGRLGNTKPGDGKRFKGRGAFFLTGRANYKHIGELLKLDLINNPEIVASKEVGFRTAGMFWKLNGLNELADQGRFDEITRRLNGAAHPPANLLNYYERAKRVLRNGDSADAGTTAVAEEPSARESSQGDVGLPTPSVAKAARKSQSRSKKRAESAASSTDATPPTSAEVERESGEFSFSPTMNAVLEHAWLLAQQTGRGRITSSCLLFAIAKNPGRQSGDTAFIRALLNRHGRLEAEYEVFLRDGSNSPEAVPAPGVPGKISGNVGALLEQAATLANSVSGSRRIAARHLFGALISNKVDGPRAARNRLKQLGLELRLLRVDFRAYVLYEAPLDDQGDWDNWLGVRESPTPTVDSPTAIDPPTAEVSQQALPESDIAAYQRTYSAFIPDRASYGRPKANEPLDDSLGVGVYAGHFAQLIAAKDTFMPLSIGLFGAWGSGKSYFIDLLDEQLRALTKDPGKVFHEQIVQVRFNAWHYLDTNLWANLVSEIFDQLFAKLDERKGKDTTEEQVENLKKKLADQSALAAEANAALATAENARQQAEDKLREAVEQRAQEETKVSTILNDLKNLLIDDPNTEKQLKAIARGLGLPRVATSFAELEARAQEVRSLGGRTKALLLALFSGRGWWKRVMLLALVLAAPFGVAWLAGHGTNWMQELLAGAGRTIAQVVTVIVAFSTWLGTQAKAGNALVNKLESAYDQVKEVRAQREAKDPKAVAAQKALAVKKQAEEEARHTLFAVEEKMKTIRAELAEMAPGRQLIRFLKDRATADDYKQHLGLVSLVRRDFEQLSNLLIEARDAKEEPKEPLESKDPNDAKEEEKVELPKIDRIVLYIDDLDRCRADRVIEVLEAVHLLLAFELFAVVVAVDPRWLRQSLLDHYPRLLGGIEDDGVNARRRILGRPATPQDYLEKIFQVPFNLQAMEKTGFEMFVKRLFPFEETPPPPDHQPTVEVDPIKDEPITTPPPLQAKETTDPTTPPADLITEPKTPAAETPVLEEKPPPPPPPDPQRLKLTKREAEDVKRFQVLFQTPRAVKRMANTYSLIRVGVDKDEWDEYLGSKAAPGTYRIPLLLLAVTSAFPSLARPWLIWLSETAPSQWQLEPEEVDTLANKHNDATDRADWDRLALSLKQINVDTWPKPEPDALRKWAARVGRYSF